MTHNFSFLPSSTNANLLSNACKKRLQESYSDILKELHTYTNSSRALDLMKSFDTIDLSYFISFFHLLYHRIIELSEKNNVEEIFTILDFIVANKDIVKNKYVEINILPSFLKRILFEQVNNSDGNYRFDMYALNKDQQNNVIQQIEKGLVFLKQACPTLYEETNVFVDNIVLYGCLSTTDEVALSMTNYKMQGMIYINGTQNQNWFFLLDKWVHEAAHAFLFSINFQEEILSNDDSILYPSPFRKESRTMMGVYHATLVLQRLIYCFNHILKNCSLNDFETTRILSIVNNYKSKLEVSYKTVKSSALMTPVGLAIIDEGYEAATLAA